MAKALSGAKGLFGWRRKHAPLSDVPKNIIHKWTEAKGVEPYLTPSGFTGTETTSGEPGSNGLVIYNNSLILCQHGDRRIAKMNSPLDNPIPDFSTVASTYEGKRFSSYK
ncbi:MAG: hypothetical protein U5K54_02390 [Cytophagales bacterium]|nr:hypothetical protein [Cytophagales bacterium]